MCEGIQGLNLSEEDPVMFLPSGKMIGSRETGEESWEREEFGNVGVKVSPNLPAGLQTCSSL